MIQAMILIGILSIFLAIRSVRQQEKMQEIEHAKKSLKRGKVIYSSSSESSE